MRGRTLIASSDASGDSRCIARTCVRVSACECVRARARVRACQGTPKYFHCKRPGYNYLERQCTRTGYQHTWANNTHTLPILCAIPVCNPHPTNQHSLFQSIPTPYQTHVPNRSALYHPHPPPYACPLPPYVCHHVSLSLSACVMCHAASVMLRLCLCLPPCVPPPTQHAFSCWRAHQGRLGGKDGGHGHAHSRGGVTKGTRGGGGRG